MFIINAEELVFVARETKQELWKERIQAFRDSGLTRRAWCREQGIPEHQLHYWLNRIKNLDKAAEPATNRWVGLEKASLDDTGITIQVGELSLAVKRGFDHHVLVDVIRTLLKVC